MRINIFKEDGKGDGKGESCGIRRFAGALTGRGSRSIIMHVYIYLDAIPDPTLAKIHRWKRWKDK